MAAAAATAVSSQTGDGVWSEILNSVKNTRGVPTKNILVLGEPSTGKRTLLKALASGSASTFTEAPKEEQDELTAAAAAAAAAKAQAQGQSADLLGSMGMPLLGLSYGYWDVADEDSEGDLLARVGAYTLPSSDPEYCSLLNLAFPPEHPDSDLPMRKLYSTYAAQVFSQHKPTHHGPGTTGSLSTKPSLDSLSKSLIILVLDWTRPHTFLEQLRRWLAVVRRVVNDASDSGLERGKGASANLSWSPTWAALDEMREHLEQAFTSYREPAAPELPRFNSATAATGSTTGLSSTTAGPSSTLDGPNGPSSDSLLPPSSPTRAPLTALDSNFQMPLPEGALDANSNWGVEIVVVCTKADTMGKLEVERQFKEEQFDYIQQVLRVICLKYGAALFYTSSHKPDSVALLRQYILNRLFNRTPGTSASTRFRLTSRASTVDRDTVFVPAGWDSYGKIKALRGNEDTFDCSAMAHNWESDMDVELARRAHIVQGTPAGDPSLQEPALRTYILGTEAASQHSAVALFEEIVGDWNARDPPASNGAKVVSPDMQDFLSNLYTLLLKEPDTASKTTGTGGTGALEGADRKNGQSAVPEVHRTVVGPLGAASLGTLSKFAADEEADPALPSKHKSSKSKRDHRPRSELESLASPRPGSASPSSTGGPQKQSEVLQTFFKSLLKDKSSVPATSGKSSRTMRKTTANPDAPPLP